MANMPNNKYPHTVSLDSLPPEILLPVITSLPNLDTLWNLLRASPQAWRLFEDGSKSVLIAEGILSGPRSTIPSKITELIRAVILVRCGVPPFEDLDEFRTRFMKAMIPCLISDESTIKTLGPDSLSATSSPAELSHTWRLAWKDYEIQASSHCMLITRHRNAHDYKNTQEWIPAWDREFAGTPVCVTEMGQSTWVEEMRVVRVMWIVHLVREMQLLATNKPGIGWSRDDISLLLGMDPVDLFHDRGSPICDTEPIESAMDYLATLGTPGKGEFYRLPPAPAPSVNNRWITAPPNYNEVFMQVRAYRSNGKFRWLGRGVQVPEGATPVEVPTFTEEKKWEQTAKAFDLRPYGINFWQVLRDHLRSGRSPLPGVSFKSFRPLGLAFWDRKRLWLLGLAFGVNDTQYTSDSFYFFAWESILPPEEVDSIKARAREARLYGPA